MAYDRFVFWRKEIPTKEEIEKALTNYISSSGNISWKDDRYYVVLLGKPSDPFEHRSKECLPECRWFEVIANDNESLNILTRLADEYTNNIATGFAELCARRWQGEKDY